MHIRNFIATCTILMISLHVLDAKILPKYHCGTGSVSKVLSYAVSSACGRAKLNKCCLIHDRCYDYNQGAEELVLVACDDNFEECINESYKHQSWLCAKFLQFTHSGAIRIVGGFYRNVVGYTPVTEILTNDPLVDDPEANMTMRVGRIIRAERLTLLNATKVE